MKKALKLIISFVINSVYLVYFFLYLLFFESIKTHLKRDCSGLAVLLANGPSLKQVLANFEKYEEFKAAEFFVLNYFAFDDIFWKIKPKHYCLADPMFYYPTHREAEAKKLFSVLEKVNWDMDIYVLQCNKKKFQNFTQFKNKKLHIIGVNISIYKGTWNINNYLYSKGWSCPRVQTVALLAIYSAIMRGFNEIKLYGVEHTFTNGLCVDEQNRLCYLEQHFYDNERPKLKPIIRNDNNTPYTIGMYLNDISYAFLGHEKLSLFARSQGVRIVNCTNASFIDSYEREKDENI